MKVVFFGATKGMGQSLARLMAERGDTLYLLGRERERLALCANDLEARSGRPAAGIGKCDLEQPDGFAAALDGARDALGEFDAVVVTAGILYTQDELDGHPTRAAQLMTVNYTNTIMFCEHARARLLERGGGTLCVFSSVSGDRGRKPSFVYGSTKAGLSHYLEGLDHAYHAQGLRVIDVRPGFVRTGMTAGMKEPPFAGDPDAVARIVLRALDAGTPVVYAPPMWRWLMFVIKRLPRFVMRKLNF